MTYLCKVLVVVLAMCVSAEVLAEIRTGGSGSLGSFRVSRYSAQSLANPFGAGSPYRPDGLMNPYSRYGSPYSPYSWTNPYATQAPRLYEGNRYRGRWSANPFDADSTSNPFGRYGSPYSPDSLRNPYGAGSPYNTRPLDVYRGR